LKNYKNLGLVFTSGFELFSKTRGTKHGPISKKLSFNNFNLVDLVFAEDQILEKYFGVLMNKIFEPDNLESEQDFNINKLSKDSFGYIESEDFIYSNENVELNLRNLSSYLNEKILLNIIFNPDFNKVKSYEPISLGVI
jgi:hypothetical protein